jgi:hypothetical protein
MASSNRSGSAEERGIALVIAILSLMILTFLGLALATATSTELQIATNFRWGQQALYNAEAGMEAARLVIANSQGFQFVLPQPRPEPGDLPWLPGSAPGPIETATGRDFEKKECDTRAGVGYGRVLVGTVDGRQENVHSVFGRDLNGGFTIWLRRAILVGEDGKLQDDPNLASGILTVEGVAPYITENVFTRAHQARRVLEVSMGSVIGDLCEAGGQEGVDATGSNYNPCTPITRGTAADTLDDVFGTADGSLVAK